MPIYTITVDTDKHPDREAGLSAIAATTFLDGLILSNEQYLQRVLDIAVESYAQQYAATLTKDLSEKFVKASPQERADAEAALAAVDTTEVGAGGGKAEPEEDLFSRKL